MYDLDQAAAFLHVGDVFSSVCRRTLLDPSVPALVLVGLGDQPNVVEIEVYSLDDPHAPVLEWSAPTASSARVEVAAGLLAMVEEEGGAEVVRLVELESGNEMATWSAPSGWPTAGVPRWGGETLWMTWLLEEEQRLFRRALGASSWEMVDVPASGFGGVSAIGGDVAFFPGNYLQAGGFVDVAATQTVLPVAGVWTGRGQNLVVAEGGVYDLAAGSVSFVATTTSGTATQLWNARIDDVTTSVWYVLAGVDQPVLIDPAAGLSSYFWNQPQLIDDAASLPTLAFGLGPQAVAGTTPSVPHAPPYDTWSSAGRSPSRVFAQDGSRLYVLTMGDEVEVGPLLLTGFTVEATGQLTGPLFAMNLAPELGGSPDKLLLSAQAGRLVAGRAAHALYLIDVDGADPVVLAEAPPGILDSSASALPWEDRVFLETHSLIMLYAVGGELLEGIPVDIQAGGPRILALDGERGTVAAQYVDGGFGEPQLLFFDVTVEPPTLTGAVALPETPIDGVTQDGRVYLTSEHAFSVVDPPCLEP